MPPCNPIWLCRDCSPGSTQRCPFAGTAEDAQAKAEAPKQPSGSEVLGDAQAKREDSQ